MSNVVSHLNKGKLYTNTTWSPPQRSTIWGSPKHADAQHTRTDKQQHDQIHKRRCAGEPVSQCVIECMCMSICVSLGLHPICGYFSWYVVQRCSVSRCDVVWLFRCSRLQCKHAVRLGSMESGAVLQRLLLWFGLRLSVPLY